MSGFIQSKYRLDLHINHKNYSKLEQSRQKKLNSSLGHEWNFVNSEVSVNGKSKVNAKIRYKGDRDVHYEEPTKTSFKINLKKDKKIFGMKEFSVSKPRTRNYLNEWVFNQHLGENNLIMPIQMYIDIFVNGKNFGLYYLEEGFSKEMIERNKRKNGPIFSLKEELFQN